jgi:hypothetical protein
VIGFNAEKLAEMLPRDTRDDVLPGYTQEQLLERGQLQTTLPAVRGAVNDMLDQAIMALNFAPVPGVVAAANGIHAIVKGEQNEWGAAALDGGAIILGGISSTGKLAKGGASACDAAAGDVMSHQTAMKIIEGAPHGSEPHKLQTYSEAITMAESGEYTKVYVNRALSTITGGEVKSLKRPDVAGVRPDATVDVIEVVSQSQKVSDMETKIDTMSVLLGPLAGRNSRPVEIRK